MWEAHFGADAPSTFFFARAFFSYFIRAWTNGARWTSNGSTTVFSQLHAPTNMHTEYSWTRYNAQYMANII